jgi:hypothetical protein
MYITVVKMSESHEKEDRMDSPLSNKFMRTSLGVR